MPNQLIRTSLHVEMQKFGENGLDLSYAENRALFAVQRMLDSTDYKGNIVPMQLSPEDGAKAKYVGTLPGVHFRDAQYLEAYGLKKYKSARNKMEYSGTQRKNALEHLRKLADRTFQFSYSKTIYGTRKNDKQTEQVSYTGKLFTLDNDNNLYASPVLVDQIDTYFVWLPQTLYTELPAKDITAILFVEYLLCQAEQKRRHFGKHTIRVTPESIARSLKLDSLTESRQWGRIREKLNELYDLAQKQGYLSKYAVDQEGLSVKKIDLLTINKQKMYDLRYGLRMVGLPKKDEGLPLQVAKSTNGSCKVYQWELQSLPGGL